MEQFFIYGAGKKGRAYLQLLKKYNLENYLYGFCDLRSEELIFIEEKPVLKYEEAKKIGFPFVIGVKKNMRMR